MTMYRVKVQCGEPGRGVGQTWECPGRPESCTCATREEAEASIASLRDLGDEWADAEYRIVEVD